MAINVGPSLSKSKTKDKKKKINPFFGKKSEKDSDAPDSSDSAKIKQSKFAKTLQALRNK